MGGKQVEVVFSLDGQSDTIHVRTVLKKNGFDSELLDFF